MEEKKQKETSRTSVYKRYVEETKKQQTLPKKKTPKPHTMDR